MAGHQGELHTLALHTHQPRVAGQGEVHTRRRILHLEEVDLKVAHTPRRRRRSLRVGVEVQVELRIRLDLEEGREELRSPVEVRLVVVRSCYMP